MKDFFKECQKVVVTNSIYDIIKYVLFLLIGGISSGTIGNIVIDILNNQYLLRYKIPIIIIIVLLFMYGITLIYGKSSRRRPVLPSVDSDYTVVSRVNTFEYGNDLSKYSVTAKCRANRKGINRYHGRYAWSGSDTPKIVCKNRHCKLIFLQRKDSFVEYEIELSKSYKKGKCFDVTIEGEMPDSQHKFVPFFSTQITEPTEYLEIHIRIPPEYNVKEVIREELAATRTNLDNSDFIELDEHGECKWEIPNPKLYYKYSIRWDF